MAKPKLTAKQQRFVDEYLVDLNATQAAARAGYSDSSYGRQLLTKPHVEAAIRRGQSRRSSRTEVTADRVLQELACIGFADVRGVFEWDEERTAFVPSDQLTPEQAAAVASVKAETTTTRYDDGSTETKTKLELKLHDKNSALREIGKHLGVASRLEHSGPDGGPIEHRELDDVSDEQLLEKAHRQAHRLAALGVSMNGSNGRNGSG